MRDYRVLPPGGGESDRLTCFSSSVSFRWVASSGGAGLTLGVPYLLSRCSGLETYLNRGTGTQTRHSVPGDRVGHSSHQRCPVQGSEGLVVKAFAAV